MLIVREDTFLNLNRNGSKIEVKIPDNISIHEFVLSIFIMIFILRIKKPKVLAQIVEKILNSHGE
jgi:hypothetical protein